MKLRSAVNEPSGAISGATHPTPMFALLFIIFYLLSSVVSICTHSFILKTFDLKKLSIIVKARQSRKMKAVLIIDKRWPVFYLLFAATLKQHKLAC